MARPRPPELSRLLDSPDPSSREQAWAAFLDAHSRLLLSMARAFGGDYDTAMDRYAYILEQIRRDDFKRLRAFVADGRSKFSTWLVVVARRLCLDHYRERYGRARSKVESVDRESEERDTRRRFVDLIAEQIDPSAIADRSGRNPESEIERLELEGALKAALDGLEPRDRLLLKLRFQDAVPVREIANLMGFPTIFHVYRRLDSLYRSMRGSLREKGIDETSP
jgi:RNA polymerase sigma factor (sigma-70 family)